MAARIGIHTGRITGGIAVADHLKYELYGSDLTVAQEMERNGVKGKIQISEATKAYVEEEEVKLFRYKQYAVVRASEKEVLGYLIELASESSF